MKNTTSFLALIALSSASLAAQASTSLTTVNGFTAVSINSVSSVNNADPDYLSSTEGKNLSVSSSGSKTYAYNTYDGTDSYLSKPTSDSVMASASLASGQLKTYASVGFGANGNNVLMPVGANAGNARASATFADSFRAYQGNSPFFWSDTDGATFTFNVSGNASWSPELEIPTDLYAGGQSKNFNSAQLSLTVFKAGGLEIWNQFNIDYDNGYWNEALEMELYENYFVDSHDWLLGDNPFHALFDLGYGYDPVSLEPDGSAEIQYAFNPGGDFDWILTLNSFVGLDASEENAFVTSDFSHTINTSYQGPDGTITKSASGVFPGTVSLTSVPVPGAIWLFGSGLLGLLGLKRRPNLS